MNKIIHLFLAFLLIAMSNVVGLAVSSAYAQENDGGGVADSADKESKGFKIGRARIHPALSLQNVFDSNVQNSSDKYKDVTPNTAKKPYYDDILNIIGGLKFNYPHDIVALTLQGQAQYSHYFGIENSDTNDLSAVSGKARLSLTFLPGGFFSFGIHDTYTRSTTPRRVALAQVYDRNHNRARALMAFRPGGGQLRFFIDYINDLENYDDGDLKSLNYMDHIFGFRWELEFFPDTAVYMDNSFALRSYYDFDKKQAESSTNSEAPDAMPLRIVAGINGKITSKFLINFAVGYGNSLSQNFASFNNVIGKLELTGRFTPRTQLSVGFERSYSPIVTYSYRADNKAYIEFKQWAASDQVKFYLHGAFNYVQYGSADQGVDLDANPAAKLTLPEDRIEYQISATPSLRYEPLVWLFLELAYTITWVDTDNYDVVRVDTSAPVANQVIDYAYFDYLKHQVLFTLGFSY